MRCRCSCRQATKPSCRRNPGFSGRTPHSSLSSQTNSSPASGFPPGSFLVCFNHRPRDGQYRGMRILVMGGTWFLGRRIAEGAIARGSSVTTFNHGRSGRDVDGVQAEHGDRTVSADIERLAGASPWDAVGDRHVQWGVGSRDMLLATAGLREQAARWVHISTVPVYADWPRGRRVSTGGGRCGPRGRRFRSCVGRPGSPTGVRASAVPSTPSPRRRAWDRSAAALRPHLRGATTRSSHRRSRHPRPADFGRPPWLPARRTPTLRSGSPDPAPRPSRCGRPPTNPSVSLPCHILQQG